MHPLFSRKIIFVFGLSLLQSVLFAQVNMHQDDIARRLNFGFTVGTNVGDFRLRHSSNFVTNDTVLVAESSRGAGFNVGIIADYTLNRYWSIRIVPSASFAEKKLNYLFCSAFSNGVCTETSPIENGIESIYTTLPILLKYSSERFGNNKVYLIGGARYAYDWASNAEARLARDVVKIRRNDLTFEYGAGLDIYLQLAKISLEIRGSYGLVNLFVPDNTLDIAKVIDRLSSRGILFSLHIGG